MRDNRTLLRWGGRPRPGHLQGGDRLWPRSPVKGQLAVAKAPCTGGDRLRPARKHGRLQRGACRGDRLQGGTRMGRSLAASPEAAACPCEAAGAAPVACVGATTTVAQRGKRRA
ncbi:hypothetical protein GW17_00045201 [Ensete ventricosum]|nr:hypothetical protein GW17_00045201 [Ensete ventricosum]